MRRIFALLALAALAVPALAQRPENWAGKKMPAFKLTTTDGKVLTNESLKGKVYLVDFWATWCPPCRAASPVVQSLHKKFSSKGFVAIGANVSEDPKDKKTAAAKYKKEHKYTYTFTTQSEKLAQTLNVEGIPSFFLVDKKGVIRKTLVGFGEDFEATLASAIKPLLAAKG